MDVNTWLLIPREDRTLQSGDKHSTSYSVGPGFKYLPGDLLPCLKFFVVFLSPSRQLSEFAP
jgi:hypothetical protein